MEAAANNTTKVAGYFNPNNFAVYITVSDLNWAFQLAPKQYIVDSVGKKINDPIFEKHVGAKRLAREFAPTPVPINWVARRQAPSSAAAAAEATGHAPVRATMGIQARDRKGQPIIPPAQVAAVAAAAANAPSQSNSSVKAMTIEQARQAGLIKPVRQIAEGVEDTKGQPVAGHHLPPIEYADDVRKVQPKKLPSHLMQPVNAKQAAVVETLKTAESFTPDDPNLLAKIGQNLEDAPPTADEPLPPPNLEESAPAAPEPPVPSGPAFICSVDGKKFDNVNKLRAYVQKKYPAMAKDLLAPYMSPATPPAA
jgi:hypothetical protein